MGNELTNDASDNRKGNDANQNRDNNNKNKNKNTLSQTSSLSRLKNAEIYYKYSVFGYIREKEEQLNLPCIPVTISYLCLSYYFIAEYISHTKDGDVVISHDQLAATKTRVYPDSCMPEAKPIFFNRWIPSTADVVVTWTLSLTQMAVSKGLVLAIVQTESSSIQPDGTDYVIRPEKLKVDRRCTMYQMYQRDGRDHLIPQELWGVNVARRSTTDRKYKRHKRRKPGIIYMRDHINKDDKLTVVLDLQTKQLSYTVKNGKVCVAKTVATGKNIQYKLAIELYQKNESVRLLNCEVTRK